jgi:hypothetical protein
VLPNEHPLGTEHYRSAVQPSPKISLAAISVGAFRITCVFILICAAGIHGLAAQSIEADTKAALANEWMQSNGVDCALEALRLLTSSSSEPFRLNLEVLSALKEGDPANEDLYRAAMGIPDTDGRPTVQGLPSFLDTLAKANHLGDMDQHVLFSSTEAIIKNIYARGPGKLALVKIHDSFTQKYKYLALYQLLRAGRQQGGVEDLEKLRAAFASDAEGLEKQVAAKISGSKP